MTTCIPSCLVEVEYIARVQNSYNVVNLLRLSYINVDFFKFDIKI